jgi:hypothetical protein
MYDRTAYDPSGSIGDFIRKPKNLKRGECPRCGAGTKKKGVVCGPYYDIVRSERQRQARARAKANDHLR